MGPYNFSLHYNPGCQNTVADSLSRIPWENVTFYSEIDYNVVKAVVHKGEVNSNGNIEQELIFDDEKIYMKQLVSNLAGKMTKTQWKQEQLEDPEIGPVLKLIMEKKHLQNKTKKDDNPESRFYFDLKKILSWLRGYCIANGCISQKLFISSLFSQ